MKVAGALLLVLGGFARLVLGFIVGVMFSLGACMEAGLEDGGSSNSGVETCSFLPIVLIIGGPIVGGTVGSAPGLAMLAGSKKPNDGPSLNQPAHFNPTDALPPAAIPPSIDAVYGTASQPTAMIPPQRQ